MSLANWREQVPVLHGSHVDVRELRPGDALTLTSYLSDPSVARYISTPPSTPAAFQGFVAWAQRQRSAGTMVCFAVLPKGSDHPLGLFQVRALTQDFKVAEWGFAIAAPFWGTGVFEDAAAVVAEFAFQTIGVHRLEARSVTLNDRGNGALLKLGARGEAVLRGGLMGERGRRDQFLWTLIADEWQARRRSAVRFNEDTTKRKIEEAVLASQREMFGVNGVQAPAEKWDAPFLIAGSRDAVQPAGFDFDFDNDPDR
jgi:ribosomal-protein-alanine N-acetyltransferase